MRGDDERKLVTVLFADLGGFTALAETLDPEAVRDLLNGLFDRLVPCVETNRGSVDKFLGDSLMAVFGAPVTHPNDAECAVRAALDMLQALAAFNQERGTALSMHFGINSGRVVAGAIGGGGRIEYTVIGDAVNVAKRLEEACAPGEILVGPLTHRLVRGMFESEAAGAVSLRGRADPVEAHRILGESPTQGYRADGRVSLTGFVGRAETLRAVDESLERLVSGTGGVLFVFGDAGLGKSRLMSEARRRSEHRDIRWLEGRGLESAGRLSYFSVAHLLLADAGVSAQEGAEERLEKVELRVECLFGDEAATVIPTIRALMGARAYGAPDSREEPEGWNLRVGVPEVLRRYVVEASRERPLVVVIDDVQWLDLSSVEALERLLPEACRCPILFCFLGRGRDGAHESRLLAAAQIAGAPSTTLTLPPLSSAETEELVQQMLGGAAAPIGLSLSVSRRAVGNPLFAEEIVRQLAEAGSLSEGRDGRWAFAAGGVESVVPDTVQGVIAARIDHLPEGAKRCLRHASVIGRSFDRKLLAAMADDEDGFGEDLSDLDTALTDLESRSLIAASAPLEGAYTFGHALFQEAAYESILVKQRGRLHSRVARAIDEVYADESEAQAGVLAFHYSRAEEWEKARHYLVLAGERSAGIAGDAEAVALYREAMAALLRAFDESIEAEGAADPVEWFVARIEPFYEARQLGELVDALESFYRKVADAHGPGDTRALAAAAVLGAAYVNRGAYAQAEKLLEESIGRCAPVPGPGLRPFTRMSIALGIAHLWRGHLAEAKTTLQAALDLQRAAPEPDPRLLPECYLFLSAALYFGGDLRGCREIVEEALQSAHVPEGPRRLELMLNLSNAHLLAGDLDQAESWAATCVERAPWPYLRALGDSHLGLVRHARGDFKAAERHYEAALAVFEGLGRAPETAETVLYLAEAQLQDGGTAKARETAERAVRLVETAYGSGSWYLPRAYWTLAGAALAEGRLDDAERLLLEGEEMAQARIADSDPFRSELLFRRALVRQGLGRSADAGEDLRQALVRMRALGGDEHPRLLSMQAEWAATPPGSPPTL